MLVPELAHTVNIKLYATDHESIETWWNYTNVVSPFTRLYYVVDGNSTYVEHGGERYDLTAGTMVVTPPFTPVNYYCEDVCEMYYIAFTAKLFSNTELFTLNEFTWSQPTDEFTLSLFKRLIELNPNRTIKEVESSSQNPNDSIFEQDYYKTNFQVVMESDAILKILISRFITPHSADSLSGNEINQKRIIKIIQYIDRNIEAPLSLEELAHHVHVHPTYLSNSFSEMLKIRPSVYIQNKRVEKAQMLLIHTDDSIKEICFKVGFNDSDYFHRVFKKHIGKTPGQYRKFYKKNLDEFWRLS